MKERKHELLDAMVNLYVWHKFPEMKITDDDALDNASLLRDFCDEVIGVLTAEPQPDSKR